MNKTVCTLCFWSKFFFTFFTKPDWEPNTAGAPSVQTPQTSFYCSPVASKKVFIFFIISALVVIVSSLLQKRNSSLMSLERIQKQAAVH